MPHSGSVSMLSSIYLPIGHRPEFPIDCLWVNVAQGAREQGVQGPAEFLTWAPGNFSALQSPFDIAIHGSSLFDEQRRRTPSTLGPWASPPVPWYIHRLIDCQTASMILHT